MKKIKTLLLSASAIMSLFAGAAQAQEFRTDWTNVSRMLIHETNFGGCLAMVSADVEALSGGQCTSWAAFSCTGELNDMDTALRMFESAQISYLTGRQVRVTLDASRKHNGHCVATRFDFQ